MRALALWFNVFCTSRMQTTFAPGCSRQYSTMAPAKNHDLGDPLHPMPPCSGRLKQRHEDLSRVDVKRVQILSSAIVCLANRFVPTWRMSGPATLHPSKDDWLSGRLPPGTALQWNGCFRSHPLVHCITPGMVRPGALSPRRNARQQCCAAYWCRLIRASPPGSRPRLVRLDTLPLWQGPEGVGPLVRNTPSRYPVNSSASLLWPPLAVQAG